jgi:hypothetical protein
MFTIEILVNDGGEYHDINLINIPNDLPVHVEVKTIGVDVCTECHQAPETTLHNTGRCVGCMAHEIEDCV